MKISFLFPGQGAQYVGMGKDLYDKYEEVRNVYDRVSNILGIDNDETYVKYCVDEACTYIYNKMQPDKKGNIEQPVFPEDTENKPTSKNEGLEFLLEL